LNALEIRDVTKQFGTVVAVNRLSLTVPEGSIYGFIGPNGSGKTTTIRMIMDILRPDSGEVLVFNQHGRASVRDDIGYLPFPVQAGGKFHSVISGDYKNAININSEHKAAAKAWIDWFADESNYATDQGGVSVLLSGPAPSTLADFKTYGVEYLELVPAPAGKEGLVDRIDKAAEIGLWEPKYRQQLVDAARGARGETKEAIFADLNKRWADAKAKTS